MSQGFIKRFIFGSPAEQPGQPRETMRPYVAPRFAKNYQITSASVTVIFCEEHQPRNVNPNMLWVNFVALFVDAGPCPDCRAGYTVEGEEGE